MSELSALNTEVEPEDSISHVEDIINLADDDNEATVTNNQPSSEADNRNKLSAESVEVLVCLKSHLDSGL